MMNGLFRINMTNTAWGVAFVMLITDAVASPLRFYLAKGGLAAVAYLPKAAALGFFCCALVTVLQPAVVWLVLTLLVGWGGIALLRGVPVSATAFSFFLWAPFLVALVCSPPGESLQKKIFLGIAIIWGITVVGVWLDVLFTLPWEGSEMTVAGQTIENNRSWTTLGIERPAGFTRISAAAALYTAASGLLLLVRRDGAWGKALILLVTLFTVAITTNKSAITGLLGALAFAALYAGAWRRNFSVVAAVVMVVGLPLYSVVNKVVLDVRDPLSVFLFASFDDRLINTWPTFLKAIGSIVTGEGLGGVGAPVMYFRPGSVLSYADNYSLYLIGTFGIGAGVLFFIFQSCAACRLACGSVLHRGLSLALFMLVLASATTDVVEGVPAAFLLGLGMRMAYGGPGCRPVTLGGLAR